MTLVSASSLLIQCALRHTEIAVADIYSPDSRVRDILKAYADVPPADNTIDTSRFLVRAVPTTATA